ncbi:TonB-dependent receptor [Emticicia agri]|uniref:TonB-dependent receptor n=1 Tax=Emticicia agri TaxID=2492393 RepID=A0A4Q5M456_9BACT|nr:TonB-dependent receptor [Emticicia agri]RYU97226.1 TonB-dependent receptor [Emticicia agri]
MKFLMQTKSIKTINFFLLVIGLSFIILPSFAQIDDDIIITKDRKVELPPANRVFEKIPPLKSSSDEKQMKYTFFDRKPKGVEEVKFSPNVVAPEGGNKKEETESYNNYVTIGAGNYGRILGEVFLNSNQENNLIIGVHAYHNSTMRGPVDDKNSANMYDKAEITGKYIAQKFQVNAGVNYNRDQYYFYGYQRPREDLDRKDIRQILNIVQFNVGFENTAPNPRVDYSLKTNLKSLKNIYGAQETDWASNFNTYFPIINEKFVAVIDAEAFITQRSDLEVDKRNLFRVEPTFKLNFNSFGASIGYKAVNEFDEIKKINRTKGFPTVELTYKSPSLLYFFAGMDGDIVRNTLGSMLNENPYLKSQVRLMNTEKSQEYYVGGKGDLGSGVSFNIRGAMGYYKNLYYFNNYTPDFGEALGDTAKFNILYDSLRTQYFNLVVQLNYQPAEIWRTYIKTDINHYQRRSFEQPFHRPLVTAKWGNTLIVSDRLLANLDLYYFGKTYAKNPTTQELMTNKAFYDLNAEFDYLFSSQFTAFVKLNNILGKKYERFLYYPQQGLNFLVGVNFSF